MYEQIASLLASIKNTAVYEKASDALVPRFQLASHGIGDPPAPTPESLVNLPATYDRVLRIIAPFAYAHVYVSFDNGEWSITVLTEGDRAAFLIRPLLNDLPMPVTARKMEITVNAGEIGKLTGLTYLYLVETGGSIS